MTGLTAACDGAFPGATAAGFKFASGGLALTLAACGLIPLGLDSSQNSFCSSRADPDQRRLPMKSALAELIAKLKHGLIVSCQAADSSPLNEPRILAALALAAQQQGAVGVRVNGSRNIQIGRAHV